MFYKIYPPIFLLLTAMSSWADLPLTIEDLLTEKQEFRLELGLNYANSDRNNVNAHFDLIQTGLGSFVLLPIDVTNQRQNSDIFVLSSGIRYGFTAETELYSRLTATADDVRTQSRIETHSNSSQRLNDLVFGINHQVSPDTITPALLGFIEVSVVENTSIDRSDFIHVKTGQIGFTSYRSIDPVVLSLTAGYRYAGSRKINGQNVNPGDLLFINPGIGFAINNEVTVIGGVQFRLQGKDKVDGINAGIRTSHTDINFGVGYATHSNLTFNFSIRADISGSNGAQAGFNILYRLGG